MQFKSVISAALLAVFATGSMAVSSVEARDNDWQYKQWRKQQRQYQKDARKFVRQQQRAFNRIDNRYFDNRWQPDRRFSWNPFTWW